MRPSRFHRHADDSQWPGEQDVHGRRPGPRYGDFGRSSTVEYVAYLDDDVTFALSSPQAIYNERYGEWRDRPHYEMRLVARRHWIYSAAPSLVNRRSLVMWWRRPRRYRHVNGGIFPFAVGQRLHLLTGAQRTPAFTVLVVGYDQQRGRAATGHMFVDFVTHYDATPGYVLDELAGTTPSV